MASFWIRWGRVLLMLLLVSGAPASAAPTPSPAQTAQAASLPPIRLRRPDPEQLRDFRAQREFQYVEVRSEMSPWDLFWARVWERVGEWLSSRSYHGFWRYVFYALFLGALVFVILKLLQVDITGAFGRNPRRAALAYDTEAEDIHALDFPTLLAEAETAGNYRLAVRLGYLQALKQLTDAGHLEWQPDKTNLTYEHELPAGPLRTAFAEVSRQFEYVWYGELTLTPEHYAHTRGSRQALLAQLSDRRAA
ncbi:DUF4129 domain-containing protein [Hymenobacter sp. NBH84]|uniref:DUF4129 domain-containing protein n=1 Tax=Hymenobacter sp. NBH84 TaxID=2596915 RepID=UPI001627955A|nr:DUF4129 domain-containing protein [Hymenobacter sp. NBH84]QNE40331.1 DUF4129 domain-containing protein [Hymenobacter sp. NBH84]